MYYKYGQQLRIKNNNIKNFTCYYFNDIIKIEDFDLDNMLSNEKSYENILVHNISYKILISDKSLRIRFDKEDKFLKVYDGTIYLVLIEAEKNDFIYNRIRSKKQYYICPFHDYAKINTNSHNSLLLEKILAFHKAIIFIKSVFNKDKTNYCYNIFLEKCSY